MLAPGSRIGSWEVWGRVGGGGMCDVWLGRHVTLAVPVVIKTLKPELGLEPAESHARMLDEARLMARVVSTNVVRAIDVGLYADTPFMVQEYVDGLDLGELDRRRRAAIGRGLPLWYVCDVVAQMARGLQAAHQTGVLHRDVKPSNVLASAVGEGPTQTAKLIDFGLAVPRTLASAPEAAAVSGTLAFMAPEALRGEPLDRRADVYGLGATAYAMRYGMPPVPDLREVARGAGRAAFPAPESPAEAYFQHVVGRMLAPAPEDRYAAPSAPGRALLALARTLRPPFRAAARGDGAIVAGGARIACVAGDVARAEADGIVNSAPDHMRMRSGVGDALRRAGGDVIEEEALRGGQRPLGECVATGPGALRCRAVLHAVSAWSEASCVGRATQRVLLVAEEMGLRTLAVPALGTGAARVTLEACAYAAAAALRWHLLLGGSRLASATFFLLDEPSLRRFRDVLEGALFGEAEERLDDVGLRGVPSADEAVSGDAPTFYVPSGRPPAASGEPG